MTIKALDDWLDPYRKFWTAHLDRLESHFEWIRSL